MAQVTGRVFITVAGNRIASKAGAKLMLGGLSREAVVADSGVVGYTEKPEVPGVECVLAHTADVSLADYQTMTNVSISFDTDTGKSFVLSNAWCANALELEGGEVRLTFNAMTAKEV